MLRRKGVGLRLGKRRRADEGSGLDVGAGR
jgi:hypothetical protein